MELHELFCLPDFHLLFQQRRGKSTYFVLFLENSRKCSRVKWIITWVIFRGVKHIEVARSSLILKLWMSGISFRYNSHEVQHWFSSGATSLPSSSASDYDHTNSASYFSECLRWGETKSYTNQQNRNGSLPLYSHKWCATVCKQTYNRRRWM